MKYYFKVSAIKNFFQNENYSPKFQKSKFNNLIFWIPPILQISNKIPMQIQKGLKYQTGTQHSSSWEAYTFPMLRERLMR